MALSRKTPDDPLEPRPAALSPEAVHDRADAVESAASRPLANGSVGSTKPLASQDHLQGTDGAAAENATGVSSDAESARRKSIAERAYYKAQKRGFAPGHEDADWLEAENEDSTSSPDSSRKER